MLTRSKQHDSKLNKQSKNKINSGAYNKAKKRLRDNILHRFTKLSRFLSCKNDGTKSRKAFNEAVTLFHSHHMRDVSHKLWHVREMLAMRNDSFVKRNLRVSYACRNLGQLPQASFEVFVKQSLDIQILTYSDLKTV